MLNDNPGFDNSFYCAIEFLDLDIISIFKNLYLKNFKEQDKTWLVKKLFI